VSGVKRKPRHGAIPYKGGVTLIDVSGKDFVGSKPGFGYKEEEHEASSFLFHRTKGKSNRNNHK
jgi:hypothetical protein